MQVVLQGSLRHFPAVELLTFLLSRGQKGTLDLETSGKRARLFFDRDRLIWAESNAAAEPSDVVVDALDWGEGEFTLLDSATLPEGVRAVSLLLPPLVEEARKRAEAASGFPDSTLFRVVDTPAVNQHVSLTSDELMLLFRLAIPRSFSDLAAELRLPRQQVTGRLKRLEELGLVTRILEETEEPADPTAPHVKLTMSKRTMVGSLTPDGAPDNVFPLLDAECTIGRNPANAIPIADGSVSSTHARLTRTAEGFVLEDLASRNGTFVNGEKVTEKRLLEDGDLIRVGKVIMTFNLARESRSVDTTQGDTPIG